MEVHFNLKRALERSLSSSYFASCCPPHRPQDCSSVLVFDD